MKKNFLFVIPEERWKRKSHYFFTDYLSVFFKLDYLVILKSYEKEFLSTALNSNCYDGIIFWGEIFDTKLIKDIVNKNIIFVPMMDYVHTKKLAWWYRLRSCKIICFTNYLFQELKKHQFKVLPLKYCEKSENIFRFGREKCLNVFINSEIVPENKNIIEKIFKKNPINFHKKIQKDTHIYLSLKKYDDIEKEMMKALSMGKVLVGNKTPTMSEYVKHNENGYLYRKDLPLSINFSNLVEIQKKSIENVEVRASQWEDEKKKLIDFLLKK